MSSSQYSKNNPPPVKVGDLLYLSFVPAEEEIGFGIVCRVYEKHKRKMMIVHWSNSKNRVITPFMEHDIEQVSWGEVMTYHGQ